jgi:GTP-binding protein
MTKTKIPRVAIVGRANVGKSSIFNVVLGRREVIVAREAGTTRDSISALAEWDGKDFYLVDTAGMKTAEDDFELTIQEQIKEATELADVILVVIEAHVGVTEDDRRVATTALKSKKPVVLVVNKADQAHRAKPTDYQQLGIRAIFLTSVNHKSGFSELFDHIAATLPHIKAKQAADRLHIALLGRPNVGKSALFNSLAKKQQAIVADRAGTTRDINRTIVRYAGREIELMDTAGIRRSGKIEVGIEKFSVLRSLQAIDEADICLLLMDANELNTQLDQKIAGMIEEAGKGLIIVVSKWDAVEGKDAYTRDALAPQISYNFQFVNFAPLIFTSSVTGHNVSKLFDLFLEIDEARRVKIKTAKLNAWLGDAIDRHPPAGLKNRQPKVNYVTQTDDDTPTFKFFGAHTSYLHWSFKRYLEKSLREQFGFVGSPIKLIFSEKHISHKHGDYGDEPRVKKLNWKKRLRPDQLPKNKIKYARKK